MDFKRNSRPCRPMSTFLLLTLVSSVWVLAEGTTGTSMTTEASHTTEDVTDYTTVGYTTVAGSSVSMTTGMNSTSEATTILASTNLADTTDMDLTTELSADTTNSGLKVIGLTVTHPTSLAFHLDTATFVTYSIVIVNNGTTDIEAGSGNWSFLMRLSSLSDPTSDSAQTLKFAVSTDSAKNMNARVTAGSSITVTGALSEISVTKGDENCSAYKYTCVVISLTGSTNIDWDSNNYYCVLLGSISEGYTGTLPCGGFVAQINLVLLSLACLLNQLI